MKRILILILALICAGTLTGCVPLSVNLQRADQPVALPLPDEAPSAPAVGDSVPAFSQYVDLYLLSPDRQQLVPVSRAVTVGAGQSLVTEAMLALLRAGSTADASSPFPEGTRLLGVERNGSVAVVDLSIEARSVESGQQLFWMRQSAAETLIGLDGVEYVNLLIAGRSESPFDVPTGAAGGMKENLSGAWAHLSADQELFDRADAASSVERTAILYYASRDGQYIAPVARSVDISGADCVTPVIEALMTQPGEGGCLRSPFPAGSSVLTAAPEIVETTEGRRMVKLAFDASLIAMLERQGLSAWQLYASLTYTLTGFLPDADGLIVLLGDGQLTRTERNGQEILLTGGGNDPVGLSGRGLPAGGCVSELAGRRPDAAVSPDGSGGRGIPAGAAGRAVRGTGFVGDGRGARAAGRREHRRRARHPDRERRGDGQPVLQSVQMLSGPDRAAGKGADLRDGQYADRAALRLLRPVSGGG